MHRRAAVVSACAAPATSVSGALRFGDDLPMLEAFEVQGFQSYWERQRVELDEGITLLAGRNDVGKSALLRAMRVFVEPQEGDRSDARFVFRYRIATEEILRFVPDDPAYASVRELLAMHSDHTVTASFRPNGPLTAQPESLWCDELAMEELGLHAGRDAFRAELGWDEGGPIAGDTLVSQVVEAVRHQAGLTTFVTPRRIQQGQQQLQTALELAADAGNLTNVLFSLEHNKRDVFDEITRFVVGAFPSIERISTDLVPAQTMPVGETQVEYRHSNDPIPLRSCGSGVEQLLALGTSVLSAESSRRILIDEPQAYLHPHAERSLLALLEEHPEHQYVIATHSHQLLASRPLRNARLVTIDDAGTKISDPESGHAVLSELGVTAADLWAHDRVLWVEGPSEVAILEVLAGGEAQTEAAGLQIRRMPGPATRFSSRSGRQAEATYAFCSQVAAAVAPLPVVMRFLFDRDEKTPEIIAAIQEQSRGQALFLEVREVENFFLDVHLLTAELADRCSSLDLDSPDQSLVQARLDELLADTANAELYPGGVPDGTGDAAEVVRGSRVLAALYREFAESEYDKVKDGEALATRASKNHPELLAALTGLLQQLGDGGQ
jgi:energy-coupling factor transporter ATP-binding protein EcfA2